MTEDNGKSIDWALQLYELYFIGSNLETLCSVYLSGLVKDISSTRVVSNTISMSKAAGYVIYRAILPSHDISPDDMLQYLCLDFARYINTQSLRIDRSVNGRGISFEC